MMKCPIDSSGEPSFNLRMISILLFALLAAPGCRLLPMSAGEGFSIREGQVRYVLGINRSANMDSKDMHIQPPSIMALDAIEMEMLVLAHLNSDEIGMYSPKFALDEYKIYYVANIGDLSKEPQHPPFWLRESSGTDYDTCNIRIRSFTPSADLSKRVIEYDYALPRELYADGKYVMAYILHVVNGCVYFRMNTGEESKVGLYRLNTKTNKLKCLAKGTYYSYGNENAVLLDENRLLLHQFDDVLRVLDLKTEEFEIFGPGELKGDGFSVSPCCGQTLLLENYCLLMINIPNKWLVREINWDSFYSINGFELLDDRYVYFSGDWASWVKVPGLYFFIKPDKSYIFDSKSKRKRMVGPPMWPTQVFDLPEEKAFIGFTSPELFKRKRLKDRGNYTY